MNTADREKITAGVYAYCKAVHTQTREDFFHIWAENTETCLISVATVHRGTNEIYNNFIVGGLGKAFSSIDLIVKSLDVTFLSPDTASVIFQYETDCIRRDTGEPFGIEGMETQIWIRQGDDWKLGHVHYSKK